jgi:hypothetical protein
VPGLKTACVQGRLLKPGKHKKSVANITD